ncbi:MAG: hypothetical protein AAF802_23195 [Planctomycetota bacterium]
MIAIRGLRRRGNVLLHFLVLLGSLSLFGVNAFAQDVSIVKDSMSSTPWYDAEKQSLVPVELEERLDDSVHRDSRWLPKPEYIREKRTPSTNTQTNMTPGGLFGSSLTIGHLLAWSLLIAMIVGFAAIIIYTISQAEVRLGEKGAKNDDDDEASKLPDSATLERIKHLPPELRRTDVNLRTECERLMNESQFDQAIILLLGHQLLLLDRHGLLRLGRGKTNGRYVRETRLNDETCATRLRATMDAFEQSYFGRHEISQHSFHELWSQNGMIENAMEQRGEAS